MQVNKSFIGFGIFIFVLLTLLPKPVHAENTTSAEIFGHRGVLEEVPENTFAALNRVAELGLDGASVDIRRTKDGKLILMCDETIDRTTDGKGRVDQLLYSEIRQYDAGSWRGEEFSGERVPLLSDVLMFCKINKLKLILNVKQIFLSEQIVGLVKKYEMSSNVCLWGTLRNFNAKSSESCGKELVYVSPENLNEGGVRRIHEEGKYVFTTILESDDRKAIKDTIEGGVDVLLLDYPYVAMDILHRKVLMDKEVKTKRIKRDEPRHKENYNSSYMNKKVSSLMKTMGNTNDDESRTAAMSLMVLPPEYVVPQLIKLLKKNDPHILQNAVWALGFCGNTSIATYIEPLVSDKNEIVRREAVLALKRLGARRSVPVLLNALRTEEDLDVRYDIIRTLGTLGDQSETYPIVKELKETKSWHVKSACVGALGHIGSTNNTAMEALYEVLVTDKGGKAAFTRTNAAWMLTFMGKKAIPFLIRAIRDNEEATRRRACWALVKIGPPAVKLLITLLRDVHEDTRSRAAQTLGWIGDQRAVTPLIWALKDDSPSVVCSAAWALGRNGSPEAVTALKPLAHHQNKDIRKSAIEAIERILKKYGEHNAYSEE